VGWAFCQRLGGRLWSRKGAREEGVLWHKASTCLSSDQFPRLGIRPTCPILGSNSAPPPPQPGMHPSEPPPGPSSAIHPPSGCPEAQRSCQGQTSGDRAMGEQSTDLSLPPARPGTGWTNRLSGRSHEALLPFVPRTCPRLCPPPSLAPMARVSLCSGFPPFLQQTSQPTRPSLAKPAQGHKSESHYYCVVHMYSHMCARCMCTLTGEGRHWPAPTHPPSPGDCSLSLHWNCLTATWGNSFTCCWPLFTLCKPELLFPTPSSLWSL
jgi:hypothetical protein